MNQEKGVNMPIEDVRKELNKAKKILKPEDTREETLKKLHRMEYEKEREYPNKFTGKEGYVPSPINIDNLLKDKQELLTIEDIDACIGKRKAKTISIGSKEKALEFINSILSGEEYTYLASYFREGLLDIYSTMYAHQENGTIRTTLLEYAKAILFNTYKTLGYSNIKAYSKVFPERVMRLSQEGKSQEDLRGYVSVYCKSRAVIDVETKRMLPVHLVFHDLFYNALKTTADIMNNPDISPKTRVDAANTILQFTKQPEIQQNQLQITIQDTDEITQLKEALNDLSRNQRNKIIEGEATVVDVIDAKIYEPEKME